MDRYRLEVERSHLDLEKFPYERSVSFLVGIGSISPISDGFQQYVELSIRNRHQESTYKDR